MWILEYCCVSDVAPELTACVYLPERQPRVLSSGNALRHHNRRRLGHSLRAGEDGRDCGVLGKMCGRGSKEGGGLRKTHTRGFTNARFSMSLALQCLSKKVPKTVKRTSWTPKREISPSDSRNGTLDAEHVFALDQRGAGLCFFSERCPATRAV